jgi:serine protease Do
MKALDFGRDALAAPSLDSQEHIVIRRLGAYGPSLIVLATVSLVLLAGPFAVRALTSARTEVAIRQASDRLAHDNILEAFNQVNRDIATKVEPSVVYISTEQWVTDTRRRGLPRDLRKLSSGSGWVYDEQGHIVTNEHVIQGADRIQVQVHTGEQYDAVVVGSDPRTDIAVLRIDADHLFPAERAGSADVKQGDSVRAFGSPFDFRFSMSEGIVSGVKRDAQLEDVRYQNFIQVDAAINPGNSGGPLTDIYGRVIGMNTAIATGGRGSLNEGVFSGIGLAIPMEMIEHVVSQLIEDGEVARGFIGVELQQDLALGSARRLGFTGDGVEIRVVHDDGPADQAGLLDGDVITAVDGERISTLRQVQSIISSHAPGETLSMSIWRFDRVADAPVTLSIDVTLAAMKPEQMLAPQFAAYLEAFGLLNNLATSTEERAARHGVAFRRGVIVEHIAPDTAIEGVIQPGTIITSVFEEPVRNVDEFYARLERAILASPRRVVLGIVTPDGREDVLHLQP